MRGGFGTKEPNLLQHVWGCEQRRPAFRHPHSPWEQPVLQAQQGFFLVSLLFLSERVSDMGSSTSVVSRAVSADGGDGHELQGGPVSVSGGGSCDACEGGVESCGSCGGGGVLMGATGEVTELVESAEAGVEA